MSYEHNLAKAGEVLAGEVKSNYLNGSNQPFYGVEISGVALALSIVYDRLEDDVYGELIEIIHENLGWNNHE